MCREPLSNKGTCKLEDVAFSICSSSAEFDANQLAIVRAMQSMECLMTGTDYPGHNIYTWKLSGARLKYISPEGSLGLMTKLLAPAATTRATLFS